MSHSTPPATGCLPGCHVSIDVKPILRDGVRTMAHPTVSKSRGAAEDSQVVCCSVSAAKIGQTDCFTSKGSGLLLLSITGNEARLLL